MLRQPQSFNAFFIALEQIQRSPRQEQCHLQERGSQQVPRVPLIDEWLPMHSSCIVFAECVTH